MKERILIIRLSALGDLVLCMGAFAAIRAKHPQAEIVLLTTQPFAAFGMMMPWIDRVMVDPRAKAKQVLTWFDFIRDLRRFAPTRVYDLQGKFRQTLLYYALGRPEWSGAVKGCSHPRAWPPTPGMHYTDFLAAQLANADIVFDRAPDLSWLDDPLDGFTLPEKFALFIPGCAPQHPHKRWPAAHYAEVAKKLLAKGITPLAIGTKADAQSIDDIRTIVPEVVDMMGKTSLKQLGALARRAVCVIGNDTGPTHLAAAVGAKTVALMSEKVDPHWSSPRGPRTVWLQGKPIGALSIEEVWEKLGC